MNLHDVVRGAIQAVNPDTPGAVYVSQGSANVRGILTPQFCKVDADMQVQASRHKPVYHERGLTYTNSVFTVWAYGDFSDLDRPSGSGGDVAYFRQSWWYVSQFLEWWPGWCSFEVTEQLNAVQISQLTALLQNGQNPTSAYVPPNLPTTP
jgi:hypothetical protein